MKKLLLMLAGCVLALTSSLSAYDLGCGKPGDNYPDPPCEPPCCDQENPGGGGGGGAGGPMVGLNPINAMRACLIRKVTDLQTYGAAPIEFTRIYNSRTRDYTRARWELGTQYTWQHNWQYELRESNQSNFGFPQIIVRYPEGKEI